jgi:hypothetical protein
MTRISHSIIISLYIAHSYVMLSVMIVFYVQLAGVGLFAHPLSLYQPPLLELRRPIHPPLQQDQRDIATCAHPDRPSPFGSEPFYAD